MRSPNIKPDAPNPAIAPRFHIDHDRRRVGDPERSANEDACPDNSQARFGVAGESLSSAVRFVSREDSGRSVEEHCSIHDSRPSSLRPESSRRPIGGPCRSGWPKADAPNAAMSFYFHSEPHWRGAGDLRR